ncbi:MAG TPA: hypothetical protein VMH86_07780 [Rhizomicrobium sp.]|nr:hypothetical protein [Rhizomicrobium sp.]
MTAGRILLAGFVGGLLAGAIDIGAACAIFHAAPGPVLQSIAGGLIGRQAAQAGGVEAMALGAFLQALISVVAAWTYGFAAARLPILLRQWLVFGILFGGAVNLFLTHIVGPLSHAKMAPFGSYYWYANLIANMLTFGPPIAFVASRMLKPRA